MTSDWRAIREQIRQKLANEGDSVGSVGFVLKCDGEGNGNFSNKKESTSLLDITDKTDKTPLLDTKTVRLSLSDLLASKERLESAGICIAVWEDGSMRVVVTEDETLKAIDDGGTIYSPQDMYHYVTLEPHERRMLHDFKYRFGGEVEWRPAQPWR